MANIVVTPDAPSFIDRNGMNDSVCIPGPIYGQSPSSQSFSGREHLAGVTYSIDGEVKYELTGLAAGTNYPVTGTVNVSAAPRSGYEFPPGATTSWSYTFNGKENIVPVAPIFNDATYNTSDIYIIPSQEDSYGVDYYVDGMYQTPGSSSSIYTPTPVTIEARLWEGYTLAPGATTSWSYTFAGGVSPTEPSFIDGNPGNSQRYSIPNSGGIEYRIDSVVVPAGTYDSTPGTSVTITANAIEGYTLVEDAVTSWTYVFSSTIFNAGTVTFFEYDLTASDRYYINGSGGGTAVEYLVNGVLTAPGTYYPPAGATVNVTARVKAGVNATFDAGTTTSWSYTFSTGTDSTVIPAAPSFSDPVGTASDTVTIPSSTTSNYYIDGVLKAAGTYPVSPLSTIVVTASAKPGYTLRSTATTSWTKSYTETTSISTTIVAPTITYTTARIFLPSNSASANTNAKWNINGIVKTANMTYQGYADIDPKGSVNIVPNTNYSILSTRRSEWFYDFSYTNTNVTPESPTQFENNGLSYDDILIPDSFSVEYVIDGNVVPSGTHMATGFASYPNISITARAIEGYTINPPARTLWTFVFDSVDYQVTPFEPTFIDLEGSSNDSLIIQEVDNVVYSINGNYAAAGTYYVSDLDNQSVTVEATALGEYVIADGATSMWSYVFTGNEEVTPEAPVFQDADGPDNDLVIIPSTAGVRYSINGVVSQPGAHPASDLVTVTASLKTGYSLSSGSVTDWFMEFNPNYAIVVTPNEVTFIDVPGTSSDSFTIPESEGVSYTLANSTSIYPAGVYPALGTVEIEAKPASGYKFTQDAVYQWSHTFAGDVEVTPLPVSFIDNDGFDNDSYIIPTVEGIKYLVGGYEVLSGQYPGLGTVTVVASPNEGYVLASPVTSTWIHEFDPNKYVLTLDVVFSDVDGTVNDKFTIPSTEGIEYYDGETLLAPGIYSSAGNVVITAIPTDGYQISEGSATSWSKDFDPRKYITPSPVTFSENDGTENDTYVVPESTGTKYTVSGVDKIPGEYLGSGTVTVVAEPADDSWGFVQDSITSWTYTFDTYKADVPVTPEDVTFYDLNGPTDDTYSIPDMIGVDYLLDEVVVPSGVYSASGTVTITAQAQEGFVLADEVVSSWTHSFDPIIETTATAPTFSDPDGPDLDQYTIPAREGVSYFVAGEIKTAGVHNGAGTVVVTAVANEGYSLAIGSTDTWSYTFDSVVHDTPVVPAAVIFTDRDGSPQDSYTIPYTEGVSYVINGNVVSQGNYPLAVGTITVTAIAQSGYAITSGSVSSWTHSFDPDMYVTADPVMFVDQDLVDNDIYIIPESTGVDYYIAGELVPFGTYPGIGVVNVTAIARSGYRLVSSTISSWSHTFLTTIKDVEVTALPVVFTDLVGGDNDTYEVPELTGVEYVIGGTVVNAGVYAGAGTISVTAIAKSGFVLAPGTVSFWSHRFVTAIPDVQVIPSTVLFIDGDTTSEDFYIIPSKTGVEYVKSGEVVAAGTYQGVGLVTISARATSGYVIKSGSPTTWTKTFDPSSKYASYTNTGNYATQPTFVIRGGAPASGFKIGMKSGGRQLVWTTALGADDIVVINTRTGEATVNGIRVNSARLRALMWGTIEPSETKQFAIYVTGYTGTTMTLQCAPANI